MQSRRDLFQAHRLMTQRAALALLRGEPDVPDQPLRRLNIAALSSVLVAAVVAGLVAIISLITHGSSAVSQQAGTVLIDQQTGTPYIFCQRGRRLCPVLNYASALLALQISSPPTETVSQSALSKYPRGPMIGIAGLPPLPAPGQLIRAPWSVCTQATPGPTGRPVVQTALAGGPEVTSGRPLGASALLVTADGQPWVIWHGRRLRAPPSLLSFVYSTEQPVAVPRVWLDALPEGPDFAPPVLANLGRATTGPRGPARVGQVYQVTELGEASQYFVLTSGGLLMQVTKLQADLIGAEPAAPRGTTPVLSAAEAHSFVSPVSLVVRGLPPSPPLPRQPAPQAALCARYPAAPGAPSVQTGGAMPAGGSPVRVPGFVDRVVLPAGSGALVGAAAGPGQPAGAISYFLVTGGLRYALPDRAVAGWLGYQVSSQAAVLPAGVLDAIPEGPVLNAAAARRAVTAGG